MMTDDSLLYRRKLLVCSAAADLIETITTDLRVIKLAALMRETCCGTNKSAPEAERGVVRCRGPVSGKFMEKLVPGSGSNCDGRKG